MKAVTIKAAWLAIVFAVGAANHSLKADGAQVHQVTSLEYDIEGGNTAAERKLLTEADKFWLGRIRPLVMGAKGLSYWKAWKSGDAVAAQALFERYCRTLRDEGYIFYQKFPDHPMRWQWLLATVSHSPVYWRRPEVDITEFHQIMALKKAGKISKLPALEIDHSAKAEWEREYPGMRAAFFRSPQVSDSDRATLWWKELHVLRFSLIQEREGDSEINEARREQYLQGILAMGDVPINWDDGIFLSFRLTELASHAFDSGGGLRLTDRRKEEFIDQLKASSNRLLRNVGEKKAALAAIQKAPFKMTFRALDGRTVDIRQLRGRVVVLQYWGLGCAGCIEFIPHLKRIYEKYHSQGLDVIGMCFDREKDRPKVERFLAAREVSWPQRMDHDQWKAEYAQYGFVSMSTFLIIDRSGIVVDVIAHPGPDELEAAIQVQLNRPLHN